jgi:hypothetical protein
MILVLTLLLMGIFLIMGMGFLQQRVAQNRAAVAAVEEVQARAIARSGLEDAMAKFRKHHDFPPQSDLAQSRYSYSEQMLDVDGEPVGSYSVSVDTRYAAGKYWLLRLSSTGIVGPASQPLASCTLYAEIDTSQVKRPLGGGWNPPQLPNPNLAKFIVIKQGDAL